MCTCDTDFDSPSFRATEYRTARTPKTCDECRRAIAPGEPYERYVLKQDSSDSPEAYVTCADCFRWRSALCAAQEEACGCSGYLLTELWKEIAEFCDEHLGYNPRLDEAA